MLNLVAPVLGEGGGVARSTTPPVSTGGGSGAVGEQQVLQNMTVCDDPPVIAHTDMTADNMQGGVYVLGSTVQYTCKRAYSDVSMDTTFGIFTCAHVNDFIGWVGKEPTCRLNVEIHVGQYVGEYC